MDIVGNLLGVSIGAVGELALALAFLAMLSGTVLLRRAAALEEVQDGGRGTDGELGWD